jgi:hypothetical protein
MINKSFIFTTDDTMVIALKRLWKNNIPSKISIFGWKLLLEKLQTREALYHKGIITNNLERCGVFCFHLEETIAHIFLQCRAVVATGQHIFRWMGSYYFLTGSVQEHFN